MLITFRQGLVRVQLTPTFLSYSSGRVHLNAATDPTIAAFADGSSDYLFIESESIRDAWVGPFPPNRTAWLYWDLNSSSGVRTFGHTFIEPTFGATRPENPGTDQHFFDITTNQMLVWSGRRWVPKIRVFAGRLENGRNIVAFEEGSQIKLNQSRNAGPILFDALGQPIKDSDGKFLTTETPFATESNRPNTFKIDSFQPRSRSIEEIPKFHCVTYKRPDRLGLASNFSPQFPAIGVAVEDINKDEFRRFVTFGYVTNEEWNFTEPPNTLLFVGPTGEVTTTVPQDVSMQTIGVVVDRNTAFIDIDDIFLLNPIVVSATPTPTPSPSAAIPSPTPTNTPTPSMTPTLSLSASQTPAPSPTAGPTSTPAPSNTPTPSLTRTPVPTITPTPSTSPPPPTAVALFVKWV